MPTGAATHQASGRLRGALDRIAARLADPVRAPASLAMLLGGFVVVWTVYATVSRGNLDAYGDMVENFVWGQEFQLGYHKHPPLFAWLTGAWFLVLPRADWAYYLLSAVNAAAALAGAYALLRELDRGSLARPAAGAMLLALTPLYTFLAIKLNANAILLWLWPWTAWAMVRAVERRGLVDAALLGALAAGCLLGKYYSAVFLASLFVASLFVPGARAFYRSSALLTAGAAFLATLGPHVFWLAGHNWQTLGYLDAQKARDAADLVRSLATFPLAQAGYLLPVGLAAIWAVWPLTRGPNDVAAKASPWAVRVALILAFGPLLVTLLAAASTFTKLSSVWGLPMWYLAGWLILVALGRDVSQVALARILGVLGALSAILLLVAPLIEHLEFRNARMGAAEPRAELAHAAEQAFTAATGQPLRIVGGTHPLAGSVAFYARSRASEFIDLSPAAAPWVTTERIGREGLLIVCRVTDDVCRTKARAFGGARATEHAVTVSRTHFGSKGPPLDVVLRIIPPTR